jgi:HSP20 family molecular chaperone IbpA
MSRCIAKRFRREAPPKSVESRYAEKGSRVFDLLSDDALFEGRSDYPPYNIERTGEDRYRITLAVAGVH